ncbi:hypothetical protein KGF57_002865 [Candida theae]|uniref:DOC domain-containing protein n=1 Tax=Candida theae TaxID=1198502 RepID=A0AAD5BEB3_9ASCO|nr:uncharacterized protein KGF57_002865 [Candida theae]KAI5958057.1 hypothetical protein KGF57_002865 [Candida theae]
MNSSGYWDNFGVTDSSTNTDSTADLSNRQDNLLDLRQHQQPHHNQNQNHHHRLRQDNNAVMETQMSEAYPNTPDQPQHQVQIQPPFTPEEIRDSIRSNSLANDQPGRIHHAFMQSIDEDDEDEDEQLEGSFNRIAQSGLQQELNNVEDDQLDDQDMISHGTASSRHPYDAAENEQHTSQIDDSSTQPSLEQIQRVYYIKGLQEVEDLQLVDLSPLATWKLSSYKQGFGLPQLREDNPESYWQSDGSNGGNNTNPNSSALMNNHLANPHSITIQFIKKVALERISIFTNYSLDESYTPSKIRIMAGSNEGWDLIEVCTVNFNQPIGWSHIIFNGIRNDGVLKCFMVKIFILANHQEGKDSHIRAIRCYGRKNAQSVQPVLKEIKQTEHLGHADLLKDLSLASGSSSMSGISSSSRVVSENGADIQEREEGLDEEREEGHLDERISDDAGSETAKILQNVNAVLGNNTGFQSIELKSVSSIR